MVVQIKGFIRLFQTFYISKTPEIPLVLFQVLLPIWKNVPERIDCFNVTEGDFFFSL